MDFLFVVGGFLVGAAAGAAIVILSRPRVSIEPSLDRTEKNLKDEISRNRTEATHGARELREEVSNQFTNLIKINENRLENLRQTVEQRLKNLQDDNSQKLELIRNTVDEKLQSTLEKRLGASFKLVSEQLEQVHKGLGEMQSLASGVGDLKKVLTNVKVRGTLGEVQLESLLEQILAPEQYEKNFCTKGGRENVEFAIKLPGSTDGQALWLPIDAKFPVEDYQRLIEAQEKGLVEQVESCAKALEARIKSEAKDIQDKYINPPLTTDFAILFLPFEGLFAEALRIPGLYDSLQKKYKVILAGPTTTAAILNSFQMGFRTLAIQKRSGEVWNLLGQVKAEFGLFGGILESVNKQLETVANTMGKAAVRTRQIEKKLKDVEALPTSNETPVLLEEQSEITFRS